MLKEHALTQPEARLSHNHKQSIVLWRRYSKSNHHVARGICRAVAGLLIFATANNADFRSPISAQPDTKIFESAAMQPLPLDTAQTIQSIDNLLSK